MKATAIVLAVFILFGGSTLLTASGLAFGQDPSTNSGQGNRGDPRDQPRQENPPAGDAGGIKIYDFFKDCVVEIRLIYHLENGQVVGDGGSEGVSSGSGFFVSKEGHILTNNHVVKVSNAPVKIVNYEYWVVMFSKNRKYKAELIANDPHRDLALLRAVDVDPKEYNAAEFGDSDNLKVGEAVYAIGIPYGLSNSFNSGIVSGLHRAPGMHYLEDFVQTQCPINFGNSGSPLIDSRGKVVGINNAIIPGANNVCFSISSKLVDLAQLKRGGEAVLPWFGLEALIENFPRAGTMFEPRFSDLASIYRLTGIDNINILAALAILTGHNRWAIVTLLETKTKDNKTSPAQRAGFKRGDLILKFNGLNVRGGMDIRKIVLSIPIGREFEIEFARIDKDGIPVLMKTKLKLERKPEGANGQ